MRALVYEGPYRVRVRDKPEPCIGHPDDAILKVTRAAICGSDLHLFHGFVPDTRVGTTFGGEEVERHRVARRSQAIGRLPAPPAGLPQGP